MYNRLEINEGVYVPRDPETFPKDDAQAHLVEVKAPRKGARQFVFDETYPYLDRSFGYWLNRNVIGIPFLWTVIYLRNLLHFGLKIEGRERLRPWRKELKKGSVAVCNHVYEFDAVAVKQALCPWRHIWIPMYAKHFNGGQYWFVRYVGGIPVPEKRSGMRNFDQAFDEYHRRGQDVLVFPEAVRWNWYTPIRPFRKGAFTMAYRWGCPVVPMAITYRERKGLYRLFGKKEVPTVTIHVGEPIMPDTTKARRDELERLRTEAHRRIVTLAGIRVNPWDAVPDDEKVKVES